jgi:hypothetical protein
MVTRNPELFNRYPMEAAAIPFPNPEITPPKTKMYFTGRLGVIGFQNFLRAEPGEKDCEKRGCRNIDFLKAGRNANYSPSPYQFTPNCLVELFHDSMLTGFISIVPSWCTIHGRLL